MKIPTIFKSRKRLIAENTALRRTNKGLRQILESKSISFQAGFDAANQVASSEMSLLHREIQELNDLLAVK
jgi:regulator of replication initiation timing